VCTKHEECTGIANDENVCHHYCVKNYDGSSKSMEAATLVKMLLQIPEENSISISTVTSDDDNNARANARHQCNGGNLPLTIEEPQFKADPSHCKWVFVKGIYNLANASVKVSTIKKGLAKSLKYCYGACVKRYRHLTAQELSDKVYNILEHVSNNHSNCHESWCYDKRALLDNKTYLAPADHRIDKVKDAIAYGQLKKIFDQYTNVTQLGYCNLPFDTQTNEALNQAKANPTPNSVCYSSLSSLNTRVALVIGTHYMDHLPFFTTYFESLGLDVGPSLPRFLEQK
jgi:hypothetical protein